MSKWRVVAFPDEEDYSMGKKEKIVEASGRYEAIDIANRLFPEYHEIAAYEIKE